MKNKHYIMKQTTLKSYYRNIKEKINMNKKIYLKLYIRKIIDLIKNISLIVLNKIYKLPFLEKPLPKKNTIPNISPINKNMFLSLHKNAIEKSYIKVNQFEEKLGYIIDKKWFNDLSLITQTCIKNSELNFNHGRILYCLISKYIQDNLENNSKNITILETGTARGFSSLCMSKAINDSAISGRVITIDCISHNTKMFWGCISDFDGEKTRGELLSNWHEELSNIIFIHGWTTETLNKIGLNRINFAFLDAQHTKNAVLEEFKYINKRQIKGDMIFFDDVTPNIFDGVCEAVKEISINYSYEIEYLPFDKNRGYALATKI